MSRLVPFHHPFDMWDWNDPRSDHDPWDDWGHWGWGYEPTSYWEPWNRRGRGGRGRGRGRGRGHGRRGRREEQGAAGGSKVCATCGQRPDSVTAGQSAVVTQEPTNNQLWDQNFGMEASPLNTWDDFLEPFFHHGFYRRMPMARSQVGASGVSEVTKDDKEFKVSVDVGHFTPQELSIKTSNGYVVVEGKHEERPDNHGFVCRSFTRRYKIPEDVSADGIKSTLDDQGHLTIYGPVNVQDERAIEITPDTSTSKDEVDEEENEMK